MGNRWAGGAIAAIAFFAGVGAAEAAPACDADNGGITLPKGFCAEVVVDGLGYARQPWSRPMATFMSRSAANGKDPGGVVALHDSKGDGHFDVQAKSAMTAAPASASTTAIFMWRRWIR